MIRPAEAGDLEPILDLGAARRRQYATYQPQTWRPASDAAARQAPYVAGLIADPAVITLVAVSGAALVGYAVGQLGGGRGRRWSETGGPRARWSHSCVGVVGGPDRALAITSSRVGGPPTRPVDRRDARAAGQESAELHPRGNSVVDAEVTPRRWSVPVAERNYLVEGLSGTGKSAVYEELIHRGHAALSTDRVWGYSADPETGLPGGPARHDTWMWDEHKAVSELEKREPAVLFICGSSRNRDHFLHYFTGVFNLRIDDDTMRRRLENRTSEDWPLGTEGVELMLALNRSDEGPAGGVEVDATQPLSRVVDELLRLAT